METPLSTLTQRRLSNQPSVTRRSWPSGYRPIALHHRLSAILLFRFLNNTTNLIQNQSVCQIFSYKLSKIKIIYTYIMQCIGIFTAYWDYSTFGGRCIL